MPVELLANGSDAYSALEARVLLLPPTARDASVIHRLLDENEIACAICADIVMLCDEMMRGAAAVIISEESLIASPDEFIACIAKQPVWSDLASIVLSRSGVESPKLTLILPFLRNMSVVERPVRVTTLMSLVRSAFRGRERQYQVRDHLRLQEESEQQLRASEERLRIAVRERTLSLESERAARTAAERAGQMKDEFLATLSHELRTPLNAILAWSQMLAMRPPAQEDLEEGLRTIARNARAQAQIIEDLLDMSRIISGKVRLEVERISLATVVQAAVDTVRPGADAKGVEVELVSESAVGTVSGDLNRLQQVFWNLLSNAVKFTPSGGKVQVCIETVDSQVRVRVIDEGEGISAEFLPHVFDRFRQADASITRHHGGLGLGLAIVKQLVELHGGQVQATSEGAGAGATFTVMLPRVAAVQDQNPRSAPLQSRTESVPIPDRRDEIANLTVLVVDDEPDSRRLVKRLLEDCHAKVTATASAPEALAILQTLHPDVLISDIGMPGEDGYSLMRRVRDLDAEHGGNTPAVALTAYARAEDRANAERAGFQRHLAKPVEPAELIEVVASLSRKRA